MSERRCLFALDVSRILAIAIPWYLEKANPVRKSNSCKSPTNIDDARSSHRMSQSPQTVQIEDIARVVPEGLAQDVQTKEIDDLLVTWGHCLCQSCNKCPTREHFHEIVVGGVETKRQALKVADLSAWTMIVSTFGVGSSHTSRARRTSERIREGDVECGQGRNHAI